MRYLAVLLLWPRLALAQPALATSAFAQALSEAYLYNPQLAERRRLRETDEGVPQALSGWRPTVELTGIAGASAVADNFDRRHVPEQRSPDDESLQLTQPLYTGGRVRAQVTQAEALVVVERASLRASEEAVLLAAATAYLDVAQNARIVLLNRNQAAVLERTLHASRQQFAVGAVTQTDVEQGRARLVDQRGVVAQSEAELAASRARFQQQVGTLPGELELPRLSLPLPSTREAALSSVMASNFDVAQARAALEATRQDIDIARAGLLPRISLEARLTRVKETDTQMLHERDYVAQAGVMVTVPLYQGGGPAAQTRQAKEAAERSRLQVDVVVRAARQQLDTAWTCWRPATSGCARRRCPSRRTRSRCVAWRVCRWWELERRWTC